MQQAVMCPQCNAPLTPGRFARSVVCSYCGATVILDKASVSAARFHAAFKIWNAPASYSFSSWVTLNDNHWAVGRSLASGTITDMYTGQRARWPTELVLLKLLRDSRDTGLLDNEWEALQTLHSSSAPGADVFVRSLPQPVSHGEITAGLWQGRRISIFRWQAGFVHSLEDVMLAYPHGIEPRASIWLWRRILETLSFVHASGMVHGAVLPCHVLIQENEHGARLVGYDCCGRIGDDLLARPQGYDRFYPQTANGGTNLNPQLDLAMSARCIVAVLGGDPATGTVPGSVPEPLAGFIQRVARLESEDNKTETAWAIREALGEIAGQVFGPPRFVPIVMPS